MRFERLKSVRHRTGYSSASIYRLIKMGLFPEQIKLGERASGWLESDIDAWINQRIADARKSA